MAKCYICNRNTSVKCYDCKQYICGSHFKMWATNRGWVRLCPTCRKKRKGNISPFRWIFGIICIILFIILVISIVLLILWKNGIIFP